MIGKTLSRYKVLTRLGAGGMGVVYKALDTSLDRSVALKVLPQKYLGDRTARERFIREAKMGARLTHANICTIYEVGEQAGTLFIAMEYVEGHTLQQEIARGPVDPARFLEIAGQISDAIDQAHAQSVIHRDLKPSNIMIGMDQKVKILDFGLAKPMTSWKRGTSSASTRASFSTLTRPLSRIGTLAYMSPEQISGKTVDGRSDIFSLGIVLYEMYTGRHPFRREEDGMTIAAILAAKPPPPIADYSYLAEDIQRIITKCIQGEPKDRYQTARELHQDIITIGTRKSEISAPRRSSIAVLPFAYLSGKKKDEYFSYGITTEIITKLSKIRNLLVISGTCTLRLKNTGRDASAIGRELGVAIVLTGEVLRLGGRWRINAQLIDVQSGFHIWAESYDIGLEDVFKIQNRVSTRIAKALSVQFDEEISEANSPTLVVEAYKAYLKGRQHYYRFQNQENLSAIKAFKKALKLDPCYAQAYAGLASACVARVERQWEKDYSRWLDRALHACERALELNPNLAEPYSARGLVHFWKKGLEIAEADARKALRINVNDDIAQNLLGRIHFQHGRFLQAKRQFESALRINPYYVWCLADLSWVFWLLGEYTESTKALDRILLVNPTDEAAHIGLAAIHFFTGRIDDALLETEKSLASNPDYFMSTNVAALIWLTKGFYGKAVAVCEKALKRNPRDFLAQATLGILHTQKGVPEATLANETALQMDSFYAPLSLNIAIIYCHFGKYQWARRWVRKAFADGIQSSLVLRRNPYLRRLQSQHPKKRKDDHAKSGQFRAADVSSPRKLQ